MLSFDRRSVLAGAGALAALPSLSQAQSQNGMAIPDSGWRLWLDEEAHWQDDILHLPDAVRLPSLPVSPPSGGWASLSDAAGRAVDLPATVEQFYWGRFGTRPYTIQEYAWAGRDPSVVNGAYRGVSWWWRTVDIPARFAGRRILLDIPGARQRAEVYLNQKLVGYSILEELPFRCDLTEAARPGGRNQLAIRITNPGGRYDWVDGDTLQWGKLRIQASHGFGGLDCGLTLSAHPREGHIDDLWVLNTPEPRTVTAFVKIAGADSSADLRVVEEKTGRAVAAQIEMQGATPDGAQRFRITCKDAALWDLASPNLYRLEARLVLPGDGESRRSVTFGFRWFAPEDVGKDALFRLNGRRTRLISAISWGYWGLNGLWPMPDLAEKEVHQAQALGLNCLNFHRNVGKARVLAAQDRMGLLRVMEPGGGKYAIGKWPESEKADANSIVMQKPVTEADLFSQRYMIAKTIAMVRAFRSHPSLIQYTLQNEIGADFSDPATIAILDAMRREDESRIIALNDGLIDPPTRAAQAWYPPYSDRLHRSDREEWGGWWDRHQGAGDQWYDEFYKGPEDFVHRQPLREAIVEFGEMEGCAAPDNHVLALADIKQRGGASYDLQDHREQLDAYSAFLDRWGFRAAFPRTEVLFESIGKKSYESWQQYLENVRINDATDFAAISGWESTTIENHSGLVDNLRNLKSDPAIIRSSLLPLRPLAKQHAMVVAKGENAVFDLWLLNDTGVPVAGDLVFEMWDSSGARSRLGSYPAPALAKDRFSALVRQGVVSPALTREGPCRFSLSCAGAVPQLRDLWVVGVDAPVAGKHLRVGIIGVLDKLKTQLAALPGVVLEDYREGERYDAIAAGGLTDKSTPAQRLGGDAGVQMQRDTGLPLVPGEAPASVIAAVRNGVPLLVVAQEDGLADGLATQLAAAGAFQYRGQVGRSRAPWMGSWYFLRTHPAYAGLPVDQAMGIYHQAHGRQANGLLVGGPAVDVFVGYGRDHDRQLGAGTFTARLDKGKILFQRVPDLNGPMQLRFLSNALAWLCS